MISSHFSSESKIPIAGVNFFETVHLLTLSRFAMYEALAHKEWYSINHKEDQNEGKTYTRFYVDDVALRLYAAGEQLANGIINMLNVSDATFGKYKAKIRKKSGITSQASVVGHFVKEHYPTHPATKSLSKLIANKHWKETMDYRNYWVHEQPPLIKGIGSSFQARSSWKKFGEWKMMGVGGADSPQYKSIDNVINFVKPALSDFVGATAANIDFYVELLKKHNITFSKE
jgi:hypothetical protein